MSVILEANSVNYYIRHTHLYSADVITLPLSPSLLTLLTLCAFPSPSFLASTLVLLFPAYNLLLLLSSYSFGAILHCLPVVSDLSFDLVQCLCDTQTIPSNRTRKTSFDGGNPWAPSSAHKNLSLPMTTSIKLTKKHTCMIGWTWSLL